MHRSAPYSALYLVEQQSEHDTLRRGQDYSTSHLQGRNDRQPDHRGPAEEDGHEVRVPDVREFIFAGGSAVYDMMQLRVKRVAA